MQRLIIKLMLTVTIALVAFTILPIAKTFACPAGSVEVSIGIGTNGTKCVGSNASNQDPIYVYIRALFSWLSALIGVVIAIAYIISGYQWMTSTGSPDRLKKAKVRIGQATLSLLLFLFMAAILNYLVPGVF